MEPPIYDFHNKFFIPKIKNWNFVFTCTHPMHPSPWQIFMWVLQAPNIFSRCYVLSWICIFCSSNFSNQIKSEYYGGNISVSIEVILLEHFLLIYRLVILLFKEILHVMLCNHSFFLIKLNTMLTLQLHSVN